MEKLIRIWRLIKTRQLSLYDLMKKILSFAYSFHIRTKKEIKRIFIIRNNSRAIFIVGNQRSGTSMLINHFGRHVDVDIYDETSSAMEAFRIKSFNYIQELVTHTKASAVVFKPLEDSHRILEFLDNFSYSKALWVFRYYQDVVNSSIKRNWGIHCCEYIRKINAGIYFPYSEPLNLSDRNVNLIRSIYNDDISEENCIAMIWYLRNTIFFDYNLKNNPRVLLVCYEHLVCNPEKEIDRILSFLELKYKSNIVRGIHNKSIKKEAESIVDPKVKKICDNLYKDLFDSL